MATQDTNEAKTQTTVMLSPATRAKLAALKRRYGTFAEVIAVAVDRLYRSEFGSDETTQESDPDPQEGGA